MMLRSPTILCAICSISIVGCLPDLKDDTGTYTSSECSTGTAYEDLAVHIDQSPTDDCRFQIDADALAWKFGDSVIMEVQAPPVPALTPGDEFFLEAGSSNMCVDDGDDYGTQYDGEYAASDWTADYEHPSCDNVCTSTVEGRDTVHALIDICDPDGSSHIDKKSLDSYPGDPVGDTYTYARTDAGQYRGRFWYRILNRADDQVCIILRWSPSLNAKHRFAVVLADETVNGSTRTYDYVASQGLYFASSSFSATETVNGNNRIVSGTTGATDKDQHYDLDGNFTFTPAPTFVWGRPNLRMGYDICTDLRAAN